MKRILLYSICPCIILLSCSPSISPIKGDSGLYGYAKKSGKMVIRPQFKAAWDFHEGMAKVGFKVNKTDSLWMEPSFDGEGYWDVHTQKVMRYTFINTKGEALPLELSDAKQFAEGLCPAFKNQRWGYINKLGQWQIAPQYVRANLFQKGSASVTRESANGETWYELLIDKENRIVKDDPTGKWKPIWLDSIPEWRTLMASAHLYQRLNDYSTMLLYLTAAARRLPIIEAEDTLMYLQLCERLAYLGVMRVDEPLYDTYHALAQKKIEDVLATNQIRRRMMALNHINYLVEVADLRNLHMQPEKELDILERVLWVVDSAGEDRLLYEDIEERIKALKAN
ncbi:MAG: WG repeat-containing protein [Bacteroidetes bacterium]|jgi:hypothetical protein|nr:WG repeat-containing protein [Bacteroidota bacterium]